ncbi:MAG: polyphosphate kinase 1 [Actinobacteria bacterium]|nr:polyphosphate kinase 1 [Actinomycetota bacterium]MDA2995575.1 polyphosphate kinase 1 [Actinomycetota bacterium]
MEESRFLNRELSWLDFNERVMDLALDQAVPLLERVRFAAIASANLDEFFQVRVAALRDQIAAGVDETTPDGRTAVQQVEAIGERVSAFVHTQETLVREVLLPELTANGISILQWKELDQPTRDRMTEFYESRVHPVLTPLVVDPGHPFPYISNLALSVAATVADPATGERRFVRLKIPNVFPRLIAIGDGRFITSEELIAAHLHRLFLGMVVEDWATFRVTRKADLALEEDEADDLLQAVEVELRRRRFNRPVRLEVHRSVSEEILRLLVRELEIDPRNVTTHATFLDLTCLSQLTDLDRPDLKFRPWVPVTAGRINAAEEAERSLFDVVDDRALLLHHPYESFASSVEAFIAQAADDPSVQTIKMTLYRAGGDSPILRSLIRAAERGVQVAVLIEIKARFDEENNVVWARRLERAGVHVAYGMVGLKTHSKVVLVVRDDGERLRRYCHIGTGNYNSNTARVYEDIGYITSDDAIGDDVVQLFNHLTGFSRNNDYTTLLVAPEGLRPQLIDLIEREIECGAEGAITLKCNSLADPVMIDALYRAGQAGVKIDLIVRGISCIRPGLAGLSENIKARSILGRYLEHSRIYRFEHGGDDGGPLYLIGSADLMPRNLERRVEVLVPIQHPKHREWLDQVIAFDLSDEIMHWKQESDGTWQRAGGAGDAQYDLYQWASDRQRPR